MFSIDKHITDLNIREKSILKVFFSMNNHQVATPEMMLEEARSYILFVREGKGRVAAYIALHLLLTDRKLYYAHSSNPFPNDELDSVEEEALGFAEGLGAMLDELDFSKLSDEEKDSWIESQEIFAQKPEPEPEQKPAKAEYETAAPAPQEQAAPQPPQQTPPSPAIPAPQQPTPVVQYSPQAPVIQQAPPQHDIPPVQQPQQAPLAPPAPPAPVQPQQQEPIIQYTPAVIYVPQPQPPQAVPQQPPYQSPPASPVVPPQPHRPATAPRPQAAQKPMAHEPAVKQAKPSSRQSPAKSAASVPEGGTPGITRQALNAGIVKPPRSSAGKELQAAEGVVSRDREALARLLTSF